MTRSCPLCKTPACGATVENGGYHDGQAYGKFPKAEGAKSVGARTHVRVTERVLQPWGLSICRAGSLLGAGMRSSLVPKRQLRSPPKGRNHKDGGFVKRGNLVSFKDPVTADTEESPDSGQGAGTSPPRGDLFLVWLQVTQAERGTQAGPTA